MIIDSHAHFIPSFLIDAIRAGQGIDGITIAQGVAGELLCHRQGAKYPLAPEFYDLQAKLRQMDALKIDVSVLSLAPTLFMYWLEPEIAAAFCHQANDALAEYCARSGGRLYGLACVPLQASELAAAELTRAMHELNLRGAQIGTAMEGEPLDAERFAPFFEQAQALGAPLLLHPYAVGKRPGLEELQLNNLVGNPHDTGLAAARLVLSGFLDRFPNLTPILAHGGGSLPYLVGRLGRDYETQANKLGCAQPPAAYLRHFYYDSILFNPAALRFLAQTAGADRILAGTDLPFGAADPAFAAHIDGAGFAPEEKTRVLEGNALMLFNLK